MNTSNPLALAALAISAAAHAQHHVEYGVNVSLGPVYIEHYEQGAASVGVINEESVIDGYGRVACTADVGFGINKARVDLQGTNPDNPLFFEYGFASSRYFDVIQFDDPELNGQHGFFDVTLFVEGIGDTVLTGEYLTSPSTELEAFWHAVINCHVEGINTPTGPIQSVFYAGEWFKDIGSETVEYTGDPLNTYQQTVSIEFIYGQPIFMDTFLQVYTRFDNQAESVAGTIDSSIDLGNSSYWGGISNLRDAQGNPVENANFSSSSGFNYLNTALPTPGDLNGDQLVDESDRAMFCGAIGTSLGDAAYLVEADLNNDETIDHFDLQMFNDMLPLCGADIVSSGSFAPPADGMTNAADLAYLLGAWGTLPSCADFVSSRTFTAPPDGKVDGADLAYLLGEWGACN